ncbi:S41 family peptidase [Cryomorphaceae bacterium 1068]|nr:S41 family peptidase [Cryomorphaceae bacterium 1068]
MSKVFLSTIGFAVVACLCLTRCDAQTSDSNVSATEEMAEKKPIVAVLKENSALPIEERIALFYKLKEESPDGYDFDNEDALNLFGYSLLWEEQVTEAIEVFKLVVAEFPESSNAYDSLGEAYLANGDSQLSLVNYEKSLELNPDNFNAEDQVEAIKYPDRKKPTPAELYEKVYTPEEYRADLDQLGSKMVEYHPAVFKFISEEDFWQNIENHKAAVTNETTYAEFSWMCSDVVASIDCSHSGTGWFYPEFNMLPVDLLFPIQTRLVDEKLYVIEPLNNTDKVSMKDEIVSINRVSVAEIIGKIYPHIPSQGSVETTKRHVFNFWSSGMIPYALDFPETYTVVVNGKKDPIVLNKAEKANAPYGDQSLPRCENGLCLEFQDDITAVLTVASFNYYHSSDNFEEFTKFMDESFDELREKKTKNLIIDVRSNGGGSPESAVYLLQYLTDAPFLYFSESGYQVPETTTEVEPFGNAFAGNCYFMMDGMGNSTTGHFMSMVKHLELGPIVGEELGANQFCTGGQQRGRLSNTKFEFYVGNNTNETTATELPDEVGILPDYCVSQSIDEYIAKVDAVKGFTIDLVNKAE